MIMQIVTCHEIFSCKQLILKEMSIVFLGDWNGQILESTIKNEKC